MNTVALNYFQVSFRFDKNQSDVDLTDANVEALLNSLNLDYRHCVYFDEAVVKYIRTGYSKTELKEILEKNLQCPDESGQCLVSLGMIRAENAHNSPKRALYQTIEDYFNNQKLENMW